jgi:hypothetical protein
MIAYGGGDSAGQSRPSASHAARIPTAVGPITSNTG